MANLMDQLTKTLAVCDALHRRMKKNPPFYSGQAHGRNRRRLRRRQIDRNELSGAPADGSLAFPRRRFRFQHEDFCEHGRVSNGLPMDLGYVPSVSFRCRAPAIWYRLYRDARWAAGSRPA